MMPSKIPPRIFLCVLFSAGGFLGNWFKFNLFFNVDLLFGSVFTMLAIVMLGRACGVVAAFIAGTATYLLWNHPWAIIIITGEAIIVSWLYFRRQGNVVIYDLIYWLCIGMPLVYLLYHQVMGVGQQNTFVVMLKQSVNGVSNALLATLAFTIIKSFNTNAKSTTRYAELLFTVMLSFTLLPAMVLSAAAIRTYQQNRMETLKSHVSSVSEAVQNSMASWISEHHNDIQILSSLIGDPNSNASGNMQRYVEILKAATHVFKGVGVFDRNAISVSYTPLEQDGKPTLGADMSARTHIATMRTNKKPFITDVLTSKLGDPTPIVILLAPIIISNEYKGYCSGVVEVSNIAGMLSNLKEQNIDITVVDGNNRVIVSTLPAFKIMAPFDRPYLRTGEARHFQTLLWQPEAPPNISLMRLWRDSFLFHTAPISESCRWQVIVEASLLPVAKDTSRYSLTWLTLLGLLIFTAIILSSLVSGGFISNVKRLQMLTRSVPQNLDDTDRIAWPRSTVEELAELSDNFQQMTAALAKQAAEQKRTEKALRDSEERFRLFMDNSPAITWVKDDRGRHVYLSKTFEARFNVRLEDWYGKTDSELWPPEIAEEFRRNDLLVLDSNQPIEVVERTINPDGSNCSWLITKFSFVDGAGSRFVAGIGIDISERKQATEMLRQREEEFKALVENAPDVISLFDRSLRRIYVNSVITENTGLDASFMVGKSLAEAGYPENFVLRLNAAIQKVLATGCKETIELDYDSPEGTIWLEIRCAPVRDADGSVLRVMTIGRDTTDRKKAEIELLHSYQEKTALLKEVHHRVKNNLQIVASLLGLQAGRTDNPLVVEVLQDTRNRVKSMALLHETLYRSGNLARINFALYLRDLGSHILASSGSLATRVSFDFRIAPLELPLEPALPCGLIVNELVTNALKHGFPGDRTGTIAIGLEPVGEQSLVLFVRDDGIGLPPNFNAASTATLGMRLVSGLAAQLGGELQIQTPQGGGVSFTVIFPLPRDTKIGGES